MIIKNVMGHLPPPQLKENLFGVPCKSLLIEVDHELGTLLTSQLRRYQHSLVAVLPLDEESEFPVDVRGADDLLGLEPAVEGGSLFLCGALVFRLLLVLLVRVLGVVVICLLSARLVCGFFLRLLLLLFFFLLLLLIFVL